MMKNSFFRRTTSYLLVLLFSAVLTLFVPVSKAIGAVYDDFNGDHIDTTLWKENEENDIFFQSGGLLNADGPPNLTYGYLGSKHSFRGDVEFVLDYRDFQTTATVFTENCPQIWLQVGEGPSQENFIFIFRGLCQGGHTFFSNGIINGLWQGGFSARASAQSGLLKISQIGSTITTSFNEGAGWVTLGTFSGAFTGDVIVQIAVYTGDNGTFHVSSDNITYEGQILSDVCQCPDDTTPPTGCISGRVTDPAGSSLANKKVRLKRGTTLVGKKITDGNGCYQFTNLTDGTYKVILKCCKTCTALKQKKTIAGGGKVNDVNFECR